MSDPFVPSPSQQQQQQESLGHKGTSSVPRTDSQDSFPDEPTPRPGLISLSQDTAPPGVGVGGTNRMSSRGSSKVVLGSSAGTARHSGHPAQRFFGGDTGGAQDEAGPRGMERTERTPLLAEGGSKQTGFEADEGAGTGAGYGTQEIRSRRKSSVGGNQSGMFGDSGFKSVSSRGRRRSSVRHRRSDIVLGVSTDGQTVSCGNLASA
jgi:hypothetical protein